MATFALALYTVLYLADGLPKVQEVKNKTEKSKNVNLITHDSIYNMS
jgi:hypothetical protein